MYEDVTSSSVFINYELLYNSFQNAYSFFIVAIMITFIFFYLLYAVADRHLTWSLQRLSKYCKLSPEMAGLTFLAFGNGAPDFFTALFGASTAPEMVLAGSVGSGLFIMSVVLGFVIISAPREKIILKILDEVQIEKQKHQVISTTLRKRLPRLDPFPFMRNSGLYILCVSFLLYFTIKRRVDIWETILLLIFYTLYILMTLITHYYTTRGKESTNSSQRSAILGREDFILNHNSFNIDNSSPFHNNHLSSSDSFDAGNGILSCQQHSSSFSFNELSLWKKLPYSLYLTCWKYEMFHSPSPLQSSSKQYYSIWWYLSLIKFIFKIPFDLLLTMTLLPIEDPRECAKSLEHFQAISFLHRIRCFLSPIGSMLLIIIAFYGITSSIPPLSILILLAICGIGLCLFFGLWHEKGKKLFFLHVFYCFIFCILWIYLASNELVNCLVSIGHYAGISTTIIGLLVLAWGNSFGDLVTNTSLARKSEESFQTSTAAIFCGPIQNVLLTLGTSFTMAILKKGSFIRIDSLKSDIYLALIFLVFILVGIFFIVPVIFQFRIKRWLGYFLLVVYMIYLPTAIVFTLNKVPLPF